MPHFSVMWWFLIAMGVLALPAQAQERHVLTVVNDSAAPIVRLFVSPPNAPDWGGNALEVPALRPGDKATLRWRGICVFDVRVVFASRAAEERRGIDLCEQGELSITPGWTVAPLGPSEKT